MLIEILKIIVPLIGVVLAGIFGRWSSAPSLSHQRTERLREHLLKGKLDAVPPAVLQMDVSEAFGCRLNLEPEALKYLLARPDAWKVLRDYIASLGFVRFKKDSANFVDSRRKRKWWSTYRTWGWLSCGLGFALYAYFLAMARFASSNSDTVLYLLLMLAAPVLGVLLSFPCHAAQRLLALEATPLMAAATDEYAHDGRIIWHAGRQSVGVIPDSCHESGLLPNVTQSN